MIDHLYRRNKYKLVECTRGFSKSTLIGIYSVLYWAWKGHKPGLGELSYILYIMESVGNVATNIEQMAMIIDETPQLGWNPDRGHHGPLEILKLRLGDDPTIYLYHRELDKKFFIKGRGSGQAMRGTRIGGNRPNLIIMDDIESEKTIATKELRQKLKDWFFGAVVPAIDPNRYEFIMIGTPLHEDSLLINALESDKWAAIQLPIAEKYPVEKGEKVVSAWPDRFTEDYIRESFEMYKDQGKETLWFQEHMLEIAPSTGLVFNMDRINHFQMSSMREKLSSLTYYISVDLAVSEKESADYTSIVVVGIDGDSGDWIIVDGEYGRWKVYDTIERIFRFVARYRPYTVAVEKVSFQAVMEQLLYREMQARGMLFSLTMVPKRSDNTKISVIKGLQPIVEMGKMWMPTDYANSFIDELKHQMSMTTEEKVRAKHDDVLDSLATLTLVPMMNVQPIRESDIFENIDDYVSPYVF
jgi:predicted phage terminase large subunit-like protein